MLYSAWVQRTDPLLRLAQGTPCAAPGVSLDDVTEVPNYIRALNHGIEMLPSVPLSLRVIREVHRVLVAGTRGAHKAPGDFRKTQNGIGGPRPDPAVFVPPPPQEILRAVGALEVFLHTTKTPTLITAGLAHAQFETIHPFLDGNGRVGRTLIPLILISEHALERPWLYISLHFKRNRALSYELLQRVRTHGEWEQWISFNLDGVMKMANDAVHRIRELLDLFERDRRRVEGSRVSSSIYQRVALQSNLDVFDHLRRRVAVRIPQAAEALGSSKPTVKRALDELQRLGIAREVTGRTRNRVYVYQAYLDILNHGD